jgi:type I restriction enzyme, S subunit
MNKYNKYKPSGIEWLGDIPEHWEVKRVKDLGFLQNGVSKGKEYFGFGFPFMGYGNVYNDKIELKHISGLANSTIEEQKLYSVKKGDVFFTRTSETIDEIGIASTALKTIPKATFSGFVIRLRPKSIFINPDFSRFFFKANICRLFLSKEISLVTRASLSQNLLYNLPVLLPLKEEQTAIAAYLDRKTAAIDKKTGLLNKKIEYYKELRKSLINKTVTKGLNPNVKLKQSGIDWSGEIPEHWEIKRLKDVSLISTGSKNSEDYELEGLYPFFVRSKEIKTINAFSFDEEAVLTAGDGDIGRIFHYINGKFDVHQRVYCLRKFKKELVGKFLFYFLTAKLYDQAMVNNSNSIVNSLRLPLFRDFKITLGSDNEQTAIATYLDAQTTRIDQIISNIQSQIEKLKELRKVLINDVVTGKIKVWEE